MGETCIVSVDGSDQVNEISVFLSTSIFGSLKIKTVNSNNLQNEQNLPSDPSLLHYVCALLYDGTTSGNLTLFPMTSN